MFKPQVINRFNLYRNGSVLIGISGEVELPEVTNLTDTLEGSGTVSYSQMSIAVRGVVKTFSPGTVKAGGKMDSSVTLSLSYYKIVIDGTTMLEIDKLNGVYIVNGKDILKEVRNMC